MLTPTQIDTARAVVSHPEAFHTRPWHLQDAWSALKQARGQTVDFDRLRGREAHIVVSDAPAPVVAIHGDEAGARDRRVLSRVRARMAAIGHGPTGGDAA